MKEKEIKIKEADLSFEEMIDLVELEHNNGWIKIESEEDLPKDYDKKEFDLYTHSTNNIITHYQLKPIEKPKPPIY